MRRQPTRLTPSSNVGRTRIFLTISTFRRHRQFDDAVVVSGVLSHFLHSAQTHRFAVLAYCFMPDHLHALVEGLTDESDFRRFVNAAKQRTSHRFAQQRGEQLWQTSYFDRTLRADQEPREVMRYIIMNPVRAGIVRDARDYEYWGSQAFGREELMEYVGEGEPQG